MDIFSIGVLNRVVDQTQPKYDFLTRTFFPNVQMETGADVHFDVRKGSRRIAPFVHPTVQGQIVEKTGFSTKTLTPAYIKDKRVFDANAPFKRTAGEAIGGTLTPQERMDAMVRFEIQDQIDMLNRRIEVMCGEVLATGQLTIEGELYPKVVLDFQRDSDLSVSLSGAAEWGDAGVDPLSDLEDWAELVFATSGVRPRRVVMTIDAYRLFKNSDSVQDILNRFRADNTLNGNVAEDDNGWNAGNIGGFDITVYGGTYIDPLDNTSKDVLPAYTVILGGGGIQGYRAFGAIRDEAAGWQARQYFSKSWLVEDPAVRYIMLQSAPIVVPLYPDAMLAATVKQ